MAKLTQPKAVMDDDGTPTGDVPDLSDETLLDMYEAMVATRMMNERGMKLQRQGRINFYVGSMGQEATHVGFGAAFQDRDWYFPHYRDPGVAIYRGASIEQMIHQCYGTGEDMIQGRQMPNHFSFKDLDYYSISSPVATQIPQAVGAGYAADLEGDDVVTGVSFGDGCTSEGDFHVGLNFAGVWDTPTVFLCENNQWAISVPNEKQTGSETFAQKADAYGFEGVRVDGNDVLALYQEAKRAVDKARNGEGPTLIEAVTYRMGPHSSSDDPDRYVPEEELQAWADKDPIDRFNTFLTERGILTDTEEVQMRADIGERIQAGIDAAEAADDPSIESMGEDVYEEMPWHIREQIDDLKRFYED
jgi:2-oxoisovalerate dehydrogenase E1 component alpha subunit